MAKQFVRLAKVTTESVFKHTGRHWDAWVVILDKAAARTLSRKEIVALLKKKHKLTPWWQQVVTSGYEVAIGRRQEGQDAKGLYGVTATKSFSIGVKKLWKLLSSERGLELWLQPLSPVKLEAGAPFETKDGYFGEIRTMKAGRSLRMTWQDPNWEKKTVLQVQLIERPGEKSLLAFNHVQIQDTRTQVLLRKRWQNACVSLQQRVLAAE